MEIRDSYRREFLQTLRESPAWDLFITSMLKEMKFIQDDVKFLMNGMQSSLFLRKEFVLTDKNEFYNNDVIPVLLDVNDVEIKASNCLISNDMENWGLSAVVNERFFLRAKQYTKLEDIKLQCCNFYPNHLSCSDLNDYLNEYGIGRSDVEFSTFGDIKSPTSPYLLNLIMSRSKIPFSMEYFFEDEQGVQTTGSRTSIVRNGIQLKRVSGDIFSYKSSLCLRQDDDIILTDKGEFPIKSLNCNSLVCEAPIGVGVFPVKRTNYIVPVMPTRKLSSQLELIFSKEDLSEATRLINRITPVRCRQGFKGNIDLRVRGTLGIKSGLSVPKDVKTSNLSVNDFISLVENLALAVGHEELYDYDFKLVDLGLSSELKEIITLV